MCTDPCRCFGGKYGTATGQTTAASCTACPSNSTSPAGSAALTNCNCNIGSTGPNGGPCAALAQTPQVVSLACNAGYFGETNAVEYKGLVYRTLSGVSPLDTNFQCQNYYLSLPSGWVLAADNADSRYIIGAYRWGADALVVANGYGYRGSYWAVTAQDPQPRLPGTFHGSSFLHTSVVNSLSTYKVIDCYEGKFLLILISKSGSACTACPAGELEIPGRACGTRLCERVW